MIHSPGPLNLPLYIRNLELRICEHLSILAIPKVSAETFSNFWKPPPAGTIKLNTNAAVRTHSSSLAVMARNHLGAVVKAWACKSLIDDPTIAEAYVIKWALSLAKDECFSHVIVESDSKSCIEAFSGSSADVYWEINALCFDIKTLALNFDVCHFSWVKRDANSSAHELAKFAAPLDFDVCCFGVSLPSSVHEAWNKDMLAFS
jgi:hypothetical protein